MKCINLYVVAINSTVEELCKRFEVLYNKPISEIKCKKYSLKSNFAKLILANIVIIFILTKKNLIIIYKKKLFEFGIRKVSHLM